MSNPAIGTQEWADRVTFDNNLPARTTEWKDRARFAYDELLKFFTPKIQADLEIEYDKYTATLIDNARQHYANLPANQLQEYIELIQYKNPRRLLIVADNTIGGAAAGVIKRPNSSAVSQ